MNDTDLKRWARKLASKHGKPAYRYIADLIEEDIDSGRLQAQDRLPTLRDLAQATGINYTTAARAYSEAKVRGLIESQPGAGSFVKGKTATIRPSLSIHEMTMNMAIEPAIPTLVEQIRDGAYSVLAQRDIYSLLRYQAFGGSQENKEIAQAWLKYGVSKPSIEQTSICPGIHSALVGLMTSLINEQQVLCVESLTYPGIKSIAAQLGIALYSLERDHDGPVVRAFEQACKQGIVGGLYLNPTMHNPTTTTIPVKRREALADVCLRYSIPIIEDDAYGLLASSAITSFSMLAPELSWYITGTSKCFGPGVRSAFVHAPNKRINQRFAAAMRALNVMSSPLTDALLSQWIKDGAADQMLKCIRREAKARVNIAQDALGSAQLRSAEGAFHMWLELPKLNDCNPSELAVELRQRGISAVASSAFATDNHPAPAIRLCCGGPLSRAQWQDQVYQVKDILDHPNLLNVGVH